MADPDVMERILAMLGELKKQNEDMKKDLTEQIEKVQKDLTEKVEKVHAEMGFIVERQIRQEVIRRYGESFARGFDLQIDLWPR